jgi:DNA-directed RNA polymerase subunit RPC12/RpoP
MRIHGIIPEYIVFEPDTVVVDERTEPEKEKDKADKGYSLTWVVDDAYLYRVKIPHDKEKKPEVLRGNDELGNPNRIANVFQKVPAIVNSLIIDTKRRIKISPIQKQTELLNKYMTNGSVKEIFIAKHGYPIFWMYANLQKVCATCSGTGAVRGEDDQQRGAACHSCGGSGRVLNKQVTDGIILKPPTDKEAPTIAPNVAGYVSPDIGVWKEMRTEQDWTEDALWFSMWGTTIEKSPNQTATGRILDENGMQNKLNDFADIVETVHKNIIDFFGWFYTTASYKSSSVNYSRKYILLTPDQHWERYLKAKEKKASERELNQLLSSYYESQYQTNDMMRDYYLKLMKVDPLPHYSLTELNQVQASQQMKDRKIYFEDWVKTVEITKIIGLDLKKLQKDLDKFVAENKQVSEPEPEPTPAV